MTTTAPHGLDLPSSLSASRIAALTSGISGTGSPVSVTAPFTGSALVDLPTSTGDDVAAAAARARLAQQSWAARPVAQRSAVLLRLHEKVLSRQNALLDVVQAETGKARGHAFEEVMDVAVTARYYGRTAGKLLASQRRAGAIPGLTRTVELRHPLGLIGLITPWNYPLTLGVSDALPALVAGNAVLHKPDTQTVLTALLGRSLAVEAGLPADLWQIVVGDGPVVGPQLIDLVDHISFTGSTATGRVVARQAGERLIGASLELGGKNAMVVCDDADLSRAVAGAVTGSFSSTGQLCVSMERIYLDERIADEFTRRFVAATRALTLGADFGDRFQVGSLVSAAQLDRVRAHVDDAVAAGARVLAGGRARPDLGPFFFEPTILTDVPAAARCFREETFGPVVALATVRGDEAAIAAVNDSRFGLNASVWSASSERAARIAGRLHAGTVNLNEVYAAAWGSIDAPMGGWGDSGLGRRHGAEGLLQTTWAQTVARQRWRPVGERAPLTGARYRAAMTAALRGLKLTGRR
jgi:succinate-semialdehyde dehydrogenase/glutarate-semialdehyde dehydrogenase